LEYSFNAMLCDRPTSALVGESLHKIV